MEPTTTCHEAFDRTELRVHRWRVSQLERLGISELLAELYADHLDWHQVARLVQLGCPPQLALRIAGLCARRKTKSMPLESRRHMSSTGISNLDQSIEKANTWLAGIADEFATEDRGLAYRILRAWLHTLRDRLTVTVAAHFAAQLPELLRGVFYDGWNPSRVPVKFGLGEYLQRFARDAGIHDADVAQASSAVTRVVRRHVSAGALDEALHTLPPDLRRVIEPPDSGQSATRTSTDIRYDFE